MAGCPGDHYELLGVPREASYAEIKRGYKTAALRWHPDKNPDNVAHATAMFKRIADAYQVLMDKEARALYDRGQRAPAPASRGPGGARYPGGAKDPYDLFEEVFADVRKELLSAAERAQPAPWTRVQNAYTARAPYFEAMRANVLAEFLDCVEENRRSSALRLVGEGSGFSCGQAGHACQHTFKARPVDSISVAAEASLPLEERQARSAERLSELAGLKDNVLVVFSGEKEKSLFWVTQCDAVETQAVSATKPARMHVELKGFSSGCGKLEHQGPLSLQVVLFAGDFASRYRAAKELLEGDAGTPELEAALLNPAKVVQGTYGTRSRKALSERLRLDVMPINEKQLDAIHAMRRRVEVIHGPPGTGKSTTIFHTLSAHLPAGAAAIVTCVCNQAVDAVAEKLCDVQEAERGGLPMVVLGNANRVGRTAGQYTLDAQAEREELVVFMRRVCEMLDAGVQGLRKVQAVRENKFLGGVQQLSRSRLTTAQLVSVRGLKERTLRRLLEEYDQDFILRQRRDLTVAELEDRWRQVVRMQPKLQAVSIQSEMAKRHLELVCRVRLAMARAAAAFLPIDARGRSVCVGRRRQSPALSTWDVGSHLRHELARLAEARRWLAFAVERAPFRVVRRTRVFLCTIPSSYRVEQLKEQFPEDFAGRLFAAICDEAAATAETYVPQMLKLAVENLVLLGDHMQLQPLVLAKNHREPEEKKVSRSLMERMLDAGYKARMLTIQYRMFESLSAIVSNLFYQSKLVTAPEKLAQDAEEEEGGGRGSGGGTFRKGALVEICWEDGKWYPAVVKRQHPQGGCYVDYGGESLYIPGEWIRPRQRRAGALFLDARKRLRWFDTSCAKGELPPETAVGTSYVNTAEAAQIRGLLHDDPVLGSTVEQVKVITLYKPQVQLLQKTCADIVQRRPNVEFVTVDACQGTEAPHVVLSTVRSTRGKIGFASNPRRLNVAISRAIKSLTLVGSAHALGGDKNWAQVHSGFKNRGEVVQVALETLKGSRNSGWLRICREAEEMAERQSSRVPQPRVAEPRALLANSYGGKGFGGKGLGNKGHGGKGYAGKGHIGKGYGGRGSGVGVAGGRGYGGSKGHGGKGYGGRGGGVGVAGGRGGGGKGHGGKGHGGKGSGVGVGGGRGCGSKGHGGKGRGKGGAKGHKGGATGLIFGCY